MKVLILSPEKKDKESRRRRKLIVRALEDLKTRLLNPIPGRPPKKKVFRPSLFPQVFYQKEELFLEEAELVIADLTDPDFKTGFLVSEALKKKKPVLGLFWKEIAKEKISPWPESEFLFIECFNRENVRSILRHFLRFFRQQKKRRGKLVVVDGLDGSGKTVQVKLLINFLKKQGHRVKTADFPRYYSSFHGGMVGRYLRGEFGGTKEVNPYLTSLTYALDRLTAKDELNDWLKFGYIVVSNRYTSANMAHQTARIKKQEREKFLNWIMEMEYKVHKLPREDLVIFLHVPPEISQKLVDKKKKRKYSSKKDIHEANLKHLKETEKMYLYLVNKFKHWVKIESVDKKGRLLPIKEIHKKIIRVLKERAII